MKETCGIYLFSTLSKRFLLCHATKSPARNWSIPKGLREDAEAPLEAALRELKEETGVDVKELNIVKCVGLPCVNYKKQKKKLIPFLVVTSTDLSNKKLKCTTMVKPNYPEVDKFIWAKPEEMMDLVHESQKENLDLIFKELGLKS